MGIVNGGWEELKLWYILFSRWAEAPYTILLSPFRANESVICLLFHVPMCNAMMMKVWLWRGETSWHPWWR